jgi:phosphoglucomutase/phosphomannomutase
MSVQGHCNFLRQNYPSSASRKIVIAFDTRIFSDISKTYAFLDPASLLLGLTSRTLAHIACEIYAGNGFEVYVAGLHSEKEYLSTPELSFAIRHLEALAGMNVSASHNHPDDNGFKFFNEQGAQDVPPTDQSMASYMGGVTEIERTAFADAVADGRIRALPAELHAAYIGANLALRSKPGQPLTVVYTPLCGTGDGSAGDVLRAAGYDVRLYGPHSNCDGTFAEIPFRLPNPEVPEAASPALGWANEVGADMVLCTDPDADRLGVFARDSRGRWRYLNGNEIAAILAYYLTLDATIGPKRSGVLIKTLVTTRMLHRIADLSGCSIVPDLLVGFKYIAYVLHCLERDGCYEGIHASAGDLVLAGEESHGVLLTPKIRDKDAAGGALVLCELLSQLRAQNKYLPEYLDTLALQCGNYVNVARSVVMRGIRGSELLARMMRSLREDPPVAFDGMPVLQIQDFLSDEHGPLRSDTERLSRNLLVYRLEKSQVVVRPSGTEPKAKVYVDVEGAKLADARNRKKAADYAKHLAADVVDQCVGRIGFHLSPSANLLPDYVDLDLKDLFGKGFPNDLLAAADRLSHQSPAELLAWLRERLAPYSAGADPLDATAPAVTRLLGDMADEVHNPAIKGALHALQQTVEEAPAAPVEWVT